MPTKVLTCKEIREEFGISNQCCWDCHEGSGPDRNYFKDKTWVRNRLPNGWTYFVCCKFHKWIAKHPKEFK